jgi:hypothetical protein
VEPVLDSWNFKLKKQVDLTTAFTKELDSTMEEVEFWQEEYEEAPLWRKWNSGTTIPKMWKHIPMKRQKSSL